MMGIEEYRIIFKFSSWGTEWIMQKFTDTGFSGEKKKRLEVVGMNDEFLTCTMDQGVFWTPEGKFPSEYIG